MKILIVNYTDGGGGGAIAPLRLYEALRAKGVLCDFGVIEKKSENENIDYDFSYSGVSEEFPYKIFKKIKFALCRIRV